MGYVTYLYFFDKYFQKFHRFSTSDRLEQTLRCHINAFLFHLQAKLCVVLFFPNETFFVHKVFRTFNRCLVSYIRNIFHKIMINDDDDENRIRRSVNKNGIDRGVNKRLILLISITILIANVLETCNIIVI